MARLWKTVVFVLTMHAWLFSISHCHLEGAGLIQNDDCEQVTAVPDQGDPCETVCKVLEDAPAKPESSKVKIAVLSLILSKAGAPEPELALQAIPGPFQFPPRCEPLSQLTARTSLPARAPSFVS